jgi:RecJ-like exonuclease
MPHRTTGRKSIKRKKWPLTRVRVFVNALTQALFEESDASARQHGWRVTSTHHGFGRRYTDPRFDTLTPCRACRGHGVTTDRTKCPGCRGSGRIVIKPDARLPPRRLTT